MHFPYELINIIVQCQTVARVPLIAVAFPKVTLCYREYECARGKCCKPTQMGGEKDITVASTSNSVWPLTHLAQDDFDLLINFKKRSSAVYIPGKVVYNILSGAADFPKRLKDIHTQYRHPSLKTETQEHRKLQAFYLASLGLQSKPQYFDLSGDFHWPNSDDFLAAISHPAFANIAVHLKMCLLVNRSNAVHGLAPFA